MEVKQYTSKQPRITEEIRGNKKHLETNDNKSTSTQNLCCLVTKSCLTLKHHGLQPARLLCPQDFSGKNTGVGCHFLFQGTFLTQRSNPDLLHCSKSCLTLKQHGLQPARLLCPWDFSGKNTGVGCHFLLQGIFPTQGSNLDLLHCRQILYSCTTGEAMGCSKSSSILPCWGSHSKCTGVACHSLLQWILFCQNFPL